MSRSEYDGWPARLSDRVPLARNIGQARRLARPVERSVGFLIVSATLRSTPPCLMNGPADACEAYRALNNLNNTAAPCIAYATPRTLACLLNWRYVRAEAALAELYRAGWADYRERGGRQEWTATP